MSNSQTTSSSSNSSGHSERTGLGFALGAYIFWGFMPLFFRAVDHIPAVELVAHRVIWALPTAAIVMAFMGRLKEIPGLLRDWKILRMMILTALLISVNWCLYVWAISVDQTSETALGYYINPLITVLLGFMFLGERMNRWQMIAVGLATFGVLIRTVLGGTFPWISLTIAFSFAAYGYLRKTVPVGATQGFLLEIIVLFPPALGYAIWLAFQGTGHFDVTSTSALWLIACGPITSFPLILYAFAAKALPLSTLGLTQYLAPSLIFLLAFFVFDEPLDIWQGVTFALIWTALIIYTWSTFKTTS